MPSVGNANSHLFCDLPKLEIFYLDFKVYKKLSAYRAYNLTDLCISHIAYNEIVAKSSCKVMFFKDVDIGSFFHHGTKYYLKQSKRIASNPDFPNSKTMLAPYAICRGYF